LTQGRFDEAIRDYNRAVQIDPDNAVVFLNRGLAMLLTDNPAEAEKDFAQCLRMAAQDTETLERQIHKIRQQVAAKPKH